MTTLSSMLKPTLWASFLFVITACQSQAPDNGSGAKSQSIQTVQQEPRDLKPAEFRNLIDRTPNGVIMDVRTETERLQTGFMINSKHLDFYRQDFNDQLDQLDNEKTYFVYCRSGQRSGKTVDQLRAKGYQAYNLEGGFMAWKEAFPF